MACGFWLMIVLDPIFTYPYHKIPWGAPGSVPLTRRAFYVGSKGCIQCEHGLEF